MAKVRSRVAKARPLPRGALALVRGLFELQPDSRRANRARWALEHLLMKVLTRGGLGSVAGVVAALVERGYAFAPATDAGCSKSWRAPHADDEHAVNIAVSDDGVSRTTSVSYPRIRIRLPRMTAAERARHELQETFYARYTAAGRVAYGGPGGYRRLTRADRLLLLVGELEAEVNNGGFSQYLFNKGSARARRTVEALDAIGARRTARMLEAALRDPANEAVLSKLDGRFYEGPEDLAVLAIRYVKVDLPSRRVSRT
jgi:hypothetical protein